MYCPSLDRACQPNSDRSAEIILRKTLMGIFTSVHANRMCLYSACPSAATRRQCVEARFSCVQPERVVWQHQSAVETGFCVLGPHSARQQGPQVGPLGRKPRTRHAARQRGSSVCDLVGWLVRRSPGTQEGNNGLSIRRAYGRWSRFLPLLLQWGRGRLSGGFTQFSLGRANSFLGGFLRRFAWKKGYRCRARKN